METPDHPIVQNLERTGYPDGKEPVFPICPVCGEECDTMYKDRYAKKLLCYQYLLRLLRRVLFQNPPQS